MPQPGRHVTGSNDTFAAAVVASIKGSVWRMIERPGNLLQLFYAVLRDHQPPGPAGPTSDVPG